MTQHRHATKQKTYCTYYFAHQPVFDSRLQVWGYEILYRANAVAGTAIFTDECKATLEVLSNLSLSPGAGYNLAWTIINFPAEGLREHYSYALPPVKIVIQVPESEIIEQDLYPQLAELKQKGYAISIDDFEARPESQKACQLADVLTVDFLAHDAAALRAIIEHARTYTGKILAKKIEDYSALKEAQDLGCAYFQGFFFKRPKMEVGRKLCSGELARIRLLELFKQTEESLDALVEIFECDVSLCMRLLCLVNSPFYGLAKNVSSIRQAVMYCGWETLCNWLRVIVFTDVGQSLETQELTRTSVLRAKFLQYLGKAQGLGDDADSLFLLGLFSLLDVFLEIPMHVVLEQVSNLDERIKTALAGGDNELRPWLELATAVEYGNWNKLGDVAEELSLKKDPIIESYVAAMEWTQSVLACN